MIEYIRRAEVVRWGDRTQSQPGSVSSAVDGSARTCRDEEGDGDPEDGDRLDDQPSPRGGHAIEVGQPLGPDDLPMRHQALERPRARVDCAGAEMRTDDAARRDRHFASSLQRLRRLDAPPQRLVAPIILLREHNRHRPVDCEPEAAENGRGAEDALRPARDPARDDRHLCKQRADRHLRLLERSSCGLERGEASDDLVEPRDGDAATAVDEGGGDDAGDGLSPSAWRCRTTHR